MIRVAISVEGQTEREFCQDVLVPYFINFNISISIIVITTSKDRCGKKHRGGSVNKDRIKNEVTKLLPSFDYVTTFYDFYGFKGIKDITVEELEKTLYEMISSDKFIPYIQKYEFETLLFSNYKYYAEYFENNIISDAMKSIIDQFTDIESINNSRKTAPSKRIIELFKLQDEKYDKVFYGAAITKDIGLTIIREKAKRFNMWIEKIENLKSDSSEL
jgi:hypothetical protein